MGKTQLLTSQQNIIDEVISRLHDTENVYSSNIVVFPGKRPAHVLRKKLAERLGTSYIPPKIFSADVFIDFLFAEALHEPTQTLEDVNAIAILFELYKKLPQHVRVNEKHFHSLDVFLSLGLRLFAELEELLIANINEVQLKSVLASTTVSSAFTVSELFVPFYREVRHYGFVTRSMKYAHVAEHYAEIKFEQCEQLIVAGFYALTESEKKIYTHLLSLPQAQGIFQQGKGIDEQLRALGITIQQSDDSFMPQIYFYSARDTHGEVFALSQKIHAAQTSSLLQNEKTAIVLPVSNSLFPVFHQTLSMLEKNEYNIALGYPVSRTPVLGFVSTLFDVLVTMQGEKISLPEYLKFVLHPYTKNIRFGARTDVTRVLFHSMEDFFVEHSMRSFLSLTDIEGMMNVLDDAAQVIDETECTAEKLHEHIKNIHAHTIGLFSDVTSLGDFTSKVVEAITYIHDHSTAQLHPFFHPFVETIVEACNSLVHSMLAGEQFNTIEQYALFLKKYLSPQEVPFAGTPLKGLQVLGFLEMRNLQFEKIFLLDANDDVLPGAKQNDVLLPTEIRKRLHLPTYTEREKIQEYLFDTMIRSAKEVHCFFIENGKKEKSRFLEKLLWMREQERGKISNDQIISVEYAIALANDIPKSIAKTNDIVQHVRSMKYSSTALNTYLRCPLQFYYQYVLRLREKEEVSGEIEQLAIGNYVHDVLANYFGERIGKKLTENDVDKNALENILQNRFVEMFGVETNAAQELLKIQISKQLQSYFTYMLTPLVQIQSVIIEGIEFPLASEKEGFLFTGKADRIDRRDGNVFILDYKTGSNEAYTKINFKKLQYNDPSTWKKAIGSLQLPLYMMMYSAMNDIPAEHIHPHFVYLGKNNLDESCEVGLFEDTEQLRVHYTQLEQIIFSLLKEITDITKPFEPTNAFEDDCPKCAFRSLCGTQWA